MPRLAGPVDRVCGMAISTIRADCPVVWERGQFEI